MKTLVLTAALVVLTVATYAQNENSVKSNDYVLSTDEISIAFYPNSSDEVTMILSKDEGQKVKVRITDSNDMTLYSKKYGKENNARVKYDVSKFPAGEYTFEVIEGNEVLFTKNFTKRENTLALAQ